MHNLLQQPRAGLHLGSLAKNTTDEEVKSFLERKKVHVVNIKCVSAEEPASNPYHVIVQLCREDYYKFRFLA